MLTKNIVIFYGLFTPFIFLFSSLSVFAFEDVSVSSEYYEAIEYLKENKIVEGYQNGKYFQPNEPITRSEFTKILILTKYSLSQVLEEPLYDNFVDISSLDWEAPFVSFAYRRSIINGYIEGQYRKFLPHNTINAAEAYKIIATIHLNATLEDEKNGDHWAYEYLNKMKNVGLRKIIAFEKPITRAEMAQLIYDIRSSINFPNNDDNNNSDSNKGNEGESVSVTIIELNDLHANLIPHAEQIRTENNDVLIAERGGVARISTKIKEIRSENPNSILLNIGDTFHGGAEAMFTNGNAIVGPVNALGIDVGVPGNWDYAYGPVVTNARYGNLIEEEVLRPNFPNLAANAVYKIPEMAEGKQMMQRTLKTLFKFNEGEQFLDPYTIIEREGIKIGIIGLTSDIVEKMHPMMAFNIEFTHGKDEYINLLEKYATELKSQGVNAVIVASELGIHKDFDLANTIQPGLIDVFFSAHTHEATFEKLIAQSGAIVVEAGNDAYLGQMDILFTGGVPSSFTWRLHSIDDSILEDTYIKSLVDKERAPFLIDNPNLSIPTVSIGNSAIMNSMMEVSSQKLNYGLDTIIGNTNIPLERRNSLENNLNNVFTDALRDEFESDLAISPGFRFDSSVIPHDHHDHEHDEVEYYWETENNHILSGEVRVSDVYRFFPAPYHLGSGNITGANLKKLIEQNVNAVFSPNIFEQEGGWVDGFSGINITLDLSQPNGSRLLNLTDSDTGKDILDTDVLTTIGCVRPKDPDPEHTLCSYPLFNNVVNILTITGEKLAVSDFFIEAIKKGILEDGSIQERSNIKDINSTSLWPDTTFYQPLEGVD